MQKRKQRLLEDAVKLVGRKELAAGLKVSESVLDSWLGGKAPMPDQKLLPLATLLAEAARGRSR